MENVVIVTTGNTYSDTHYTFCSEEEAIKFFKAMSKAIRLTRDYVTGTGYVYTEAKNQEKPVLTYANKCSRKELEALNEEERLKAEAAKEAERVKEELRKAEEEAIKEELGVTDE